MSHPSVLTMIGVYLFWSAGVAFDVIYALKAPWWNSWIGRNLFFFDLLVVLILTPRALQYATGISIGQPWIPLWHILAGLLVIHRIYLLLRAQKGWNFWGRKDET